MANIKEAMYLSLSQSADVTAIVGNRIYPDQLDENSEMPDLAFQVVSHVQPKAFRSVVSISMDRVQITAYALQRQDLTKLYDAIKAIWDVKYQTTIGGLFVKASHISPDEGAVDEDEAAEDGEGSGVRVMRLDVMVTY